MISSDGNLTGGMVWWVVLGTATIGLELVRGATFFLLTQRPRRRKERKGDGSSCSFAVFAILR
jgi:hypothetical protein